MAISLRTLFLGPLYPLADKPQSRAPDYRKPVVNGERYALCCTDTLQICRACGR